MDEIESQNIIKEIHKKTDLRKYIEISFGSRKIGPLNFSSLADHCISATKTSVPAFKAFRRLERLWVLLCYQLYVLKEVDGPIIECGVFRGFSALAMNILMHELKKLEGKELRKLYLLDSFEGLSKPVAEDYVRLPEGAKNAENSIVKKGHFATPIEEVERVFSNMNNVNFIKGWIPEAFDSLPEEKWSFVHIDVDLYEPIHNCLEYFYPRMQKGGIIINDDFGSALFPGAGQAWREFFDNKNEGYAILDTGQAVFIKK